MFELTYDLRENVRLAEDLVLFAVDFDFRSTVLAEDHFVANGDRKLTAVARIEQLARARRYDLPTLRLFLSRIRQHDPASRHLFSLQRLNNNPIIQRTQLNLGHVSLLLFLSQLCF